MMAAKCFMRWWWAWWGTGRQLATPFAAVRRGWGRDMLLRERFLLHRQVLYALTAGVAGYVSAVSYKIMGGTAWVRNVLLTTALFCGPLLATFSFLNTVAIVYRTTTALPFGTIVIILVIWALITFPLTVLGGIAGKNSKVWPLP